ETFDNKQPQIITLDLTVQGKVKFFEVSTVNLTKEIIAILIRDLAKNEEFMSILLESMPDLSFLITYDTTIIDYRGKESDLYLPPEDFLGKRLLDYIPESLSDKLRYVIKLTKESRLPQILEYDLPVQGRNRHFKAHFVYLTEDKLAVLIKEVIELKKIYQKMKASQERFRKAAEHTSIGLMIVQDNKFVYINNASVQMLEYSKNEILSWVFDEFLQIIDEDDKIRFSEWVEEMDEESIDFVPHTSYHIKTNSGIVMKGYHFSKTIIWDNKFADLIAILNESDKGTRLELKKNHQKFFTELEQIRDEFLNRISHELKTPLISIFGASDYLLNYYREKIDIDVVNFIELIHRGGKRLKNLIENFITASSLDLNKIKLEREPTDIIEIITTCVEDLEPSIQRRNLYITIDLPEKLVLNADKKRIREIMLNIIANAINNTPRRGSISINLRENEEYLDIFIKDTGVGLTKKELQVIFKKFGKIERYGKDMDVYIEGPGLGLFISKKLVELHNGEIWAESEGRNRGSTFIIRLSK
ncbi:MAG: ATP-binding protein, partial [Promethearchaeota archaeon]